MAHAARSTARPTAQIACALLLAAAAPVAAEARAAERPWHEARVGRLTVTGDVAGRSVASLAAELGAFREVLDRLLPGALAGTAASRRIEVFAFESRSELRHRYPAAPRGVNGVFVATPLADYVLVHAASAAGRETALHEIAHQRLRAGSRPLPVWLSEGLAYWCQSFRIVDGEAELGRPVAGAPAGAALPLDRLLAADADAPDYATRGFAGGSFALVHYLLSRSGPEAERVSELFGALAEGAPSAPALEAALGCPLAEIEARVSAHVRAGLEPARRALASAQPVTGPVAATLDRAEALARLGELRYAAAGDSDGAARLFEDALAASPANDRASVGLALVENSRRQREAARRRVLEILQRSPEDSVAWFALGEVAMASFADWRETRGPDTELALHPTLLEAREAFRKAMLLDGAPVAARDNFARTWLFDPEPNAPGIEACTDALALAGDAEIGLTLVRLHADDGSREAAHAARDRHVLPWRASLGASSAAWRRIARGLVVADVVLAQRLAESGRRVEALAVLETALQETDGELAFEIEARLAALRAADGAS